MSVKNRVSGVLNCSLPFTKLPTYADIVSAVCFEINNQNISKKSAIDSITKQVNELWQRAQISTVSKQRVKARITDYFEKYYSLYKANASSRTYNDKVESFKVKYD